MPYTKREFNWSNNDILRRTSVQELLHTIPGSYGADGLREGLQETPSRVAKAWADWTSGYDVDIAALLKTFEDGAEGCVRVFS